MNALFEAGRLLSASASRLDRTIEVFDVTTMTAEGLTARGFVDELLIALDAVPERYRGDVKLELSRDGFGGVNECRAFYRRPETDAEMSSRQEEARLRERRLAQEQREDAFAEYTRLKRIFEPGTPENTVAQL